MCFISPSNKYLASYVRLERLHDTELELNRSLLVTKPASGGPGGLDLCPPDTAKKEREREGELHVEIAKLISAVVNTTQNTGSTSQKTQWVSIT